MEAIIKGNPIVSLDISAGSWHESCFPRNSEVNVFGLLYPVDV